MSRFGGNGEQLNNVFKTLLQYYVSPASLVFEKPNRAEFTSYFLLGQLGNVGSGKVSLVCGIPQEILRSPQIVFAMDVGVNTSDLPDFSAYRGAQTIAGVYDDQIRR